MSDAQSVVSIVDRDYLIVVNRYNSETMRVLNLASATRERIVIGRERESVMRIFVELAIRDQPDHPQIGIRNMAKFLELFFDFRLLTNKRKSLSSLSIETEMFKIKKKLEEKEY